MDDDRLPQGPGPGPGAPDPGPFGRDRPDPGPSDPDVPDPGRRVRRPGQSRFPARAWLLAAPLLLLAWPPLYNRTEPVVAGIPFFYAYQLIMIPAAALCTWVVYRRDGRHPDQDDPDAP